MYKCYESHNVDNIYLDVCKDLVESKEIANTKELNNVRITLTDINNNIVSVRNLSRKYLFGELVWYFAGRQDLEFISKFSSFWENISDDGVTCNSAYGHLITAKYGFNQLEKIVELLKKDPDSRRALININVPNEKVIETKDEPCTICLQFLIRDGKLDCTGIMRSNDVWLGFPYDVVFFTELQKLIAQALGVGYGTYTHFATSFHMYTRDEEKIRNILANPVSKPIKFDSEKFFLTVESLESVVVNCDKAIAGDRLLYVLDKLGITD